MERDYDNYQYSKELAERIFCDNLNDCMKFPKYFNIGTTNYCNAKCKMCPHSKGNKAGQMMGEELFNKILREISVYSDWVESVAVYWYGEPLLDSHLCDRIAKLKQAGIKNIQLSTNGYGLNKEVARDILEAGLNDLRISIDAMKKETYERIRYGLDFDKVMKNVLDTFEIRNGKYSEIPIRIRLTEMEDNLHEIEDFITYWGG